MRDAVPVSYCSFRCGEQLNYETVGSMPKTVVMMQDWTSSHKFFQEHTSLTI
jgi:hypothetical protein